MTNKKQKEKFMSVKKQWLIISGLMVVLFVFAFGVYSADWLWNKGKSQANGTAGQVTIEGLAVCLPHKDTSGPQTMECAVGLKANSGKYYGVKNKDITSSVGTNKTIKVTGFLEEIADSKYAIEGMLRATE
jgi:hypothetical protein